MITARKPTWTDQRALPEEAFVYTAEMTAIKTALKEIKEGEDIRQVIFILVVLNAGHREQQRKSPNTKSDWTYQTNPQTFVIKK